MTAIYSTGAVVMSSVLISKKVKR